MNDSCANSRFIVERAPLLQDTSFVVHKYLHAQLMSRGGLLR